MASEGSRLPRDGLGFFGIDLWGADVVGSEAVTAVRVQAYARRKTAARPFGVVNDYIGSKLGTLIGLSVPPGSLIALHGGHYAYLSLAFGDRSERLPPAIHAFKTF